MWKHHRNRPSSKNGTLKQVGGDPSVEESWKKGQFRMSGRTWSLPSQDSGAGKVCLVGPAVRHPKVKDGLTEAQAWKQYCVTQFISLIFQMRKTEAQRGNVSP